MTKFKGKKNTIFNTHTLYLRYFSWFVLVVRWITIAFVFTSFLYCWFYFSLSPPPCFLDIYGDGGGGGYVEIDISIYATRLDLHLSYWDQYQFIRVVRSETQYELVCPSVASVGWKVGRSFGWSLGWSPCHHFLKGGKFHFHAPIGALVTYILYNSEGKLYIGSL